jgi:segregation and condensation protein B
LLFVACEPLTAKQLAKLLEISEERAVAAAEEIAAAYDGHGFCLQRLAGGWQFVTPEEYAPLVEKLYRPKYQQLSHAALETLSIIAYKQPVTRAEISDIRQVDSDGVVSTLLEKKLIAEVGRLNSAGRAILYGTSNDFLAFFGLNSLKELPQLPSAEERDD